jgi:hypothetical protein
LDVGGLRLVGTERRHCGPYNAAFAQHFGKALSYVSSPKSARNLQPALERGVKDGNRKFGGFLLVAQLFFGLYQSSPPFFNASGPVYAEKYHLTTQLFPPVKKLRGEYVKGQMV